MGKVTLTRHRTVADAVPDDLGRDRVYLTQERDDGPDRHGNDRVHVGQLSRTDWEDMGSPAQVTVSFEPGNTLEG